ncbi:MAG: protein kinase [Polyangiaceae bacterium]
MLCLQCGATVEETAAWCTSCGAPIQKPAQEPSTAPGEPLAEALRAAAPLPELPNAKPTQLQAGRVIDGKYSVTRVLGEGGMGVVYLARDVNTGSDVVLKSVRPDLAHRADIRERTLAEGRALARIDHPNVVHLNAVVSEGQHLWLVMQYIDGESLDKTIARAEKDGAHLPFPKALALFKQILRGVGAAHDEGVIHRDLKPANILVRAKDGIAKVTDFGIAKPIEKSAAEGAGKTKGVIGSLWYMSPEQVQGKKDLDKRVDIYGLGILFFELLTGHVPFDAQSSYELMRKHVEDPLPKVCAERSDVPAWVDQILAVACAKNRDERFASCEDMLSAIEAHAGPGPSAAGATREVAARTQPDAAPLPAKGSSTWLIVALVVVALGATAVALYMTFGQPEPAPRKKKPTATAVVSADPPPGESSAPVEESAAPSGTVEPPPKPDLLDALVGSWKSENGRVFDASRVGKRVEFRIHDAKQFLPADWRDGETRFTLTPIEGEPGTFAVEDKIRPDPPQGSTYDSEKSRNSCQQVWTEVGKKPLRATFDGTRIATDYALIEPTLANFVQEGKKVVSCSNLKGVKASVGSVSFTRADPPR